MDTRIFVVATAVLLGALSPSVEAHGGRYRGPGDLVPPRPGSSGGGGSGPSGPAGPTSPGPTTPGPGSPVGPAPRGGTSSTGGPAGNPRGGPSSGPRFELDTDASGWETWWEINKAPYLRLRQGDTSGVVSGSDESLLGWSRRVEASDTMRPTDRDRFDVVLPALRRTLESTSDTDIVTSAMIAIAKVGAAGDPAALHELFASRLASSSQEVSETAAIALGIAATGAAADLQLLTDLATDSAAGRARCNRREVNDRTRSFALYGLGLIAYANTDVQWKRRVFQPLCHVLADDSIVSRNLKVAAISAIGLLNIGSADQAGKELLAEAIAALDAYYSRPLGPGEQLIQAHVPTAIVRLLAHSDPDDAVTMTWKQRFAADLAGKGAVAHSSHDIARSCALALGQLCRPVDDDRAADAPYCRLLQATSKEHKDVQTRNFAVLALGQIGGKANRSALLQALPKARTLELPWIALALGVMAFERHDEALARGAAGEIDDEVGRSLQSALAETKEPSGQGAIAIALGLGRYRAAGDALRQQLQANKQKDDVAGYTCIGLALMADVRSRDEMRTLLARSGRRTALFQQVAIALGKLGDREVAHDLQAHLRAEANLATMAAVAAALGFVGDRRSIAPLIAIQDDAALSGLGRAFAAAALGGVADKEDLVWNSKIGVNLNYRAAVETLTDKVAGILDLL